MPPRCGTIFIVRCRINGLAHSPPTRRTRLQHSSFYMNGIVDEKAELTEKTLPQIRMPNRDGFVLDPRPDVLRKNEKTESKVK